MKSRSVAGNPACHSERSEESLYSLDSETLRFAQGDRNRLSGQASRDIRHMFLHARITLAAT